MLPKHNGPFSFLFSGSVGPVARSSARIKAAVREAAEREEEWPARVSAGIHAALEVAAREPAALEGECAALVDYFSERLRENAPPQRDHPGRREGQPLQAIAQIVEDHLRLGRSERLLEVAPDLVQLALLPYLGFEEAKRWAERADRPQREA